MAAATVVADSESELVAELMCPLTGGLMTDPVRVPAELEVTHARVLTFAASHTHPAQVCAADGITYERSAIEEWFSQSPAGNATSPLTGERVAFTALIPNVVLRSMTQKMKRRLFRD
jgi:hypothetical protein